ncbi:hypothetical protein JCM1393_16270 [Clostridium carnis]
MGKVKNKKRFITFIGFLIICIFGVSFLFSKFNNNTVDAKADIVENEQTVVKNNENKNVEEQQMQENKKLDNSDYLLLKDDPNADDAAKVIPETMYKWNFYRDDGKKIAYLTFDDGPSENVTKEILDTLKLNNVKATFFTLGKSIEKNPNSHKLIKRMAKEGHAIANHGYSHKYEILYPNGTVDIKAFMNDMKKNEDILKGILGKDFSTRVIRMPGGHMSWKGMAALDEELVKNGMYQTDWNALNGDAEGHGFSSEQLLSRLKETVKDQDVAIILMHDTDAKKSTAKYLQGAIDYLKSQGFQFRTFK